jgi:hypothetical protein
MNTVQPQGLLPMSLYDTASGAKVMKCCLRNGTMILKRKFERVSEELAIAHFKVSGWHLPRWNDEHNVKPLRIGSPQLGFS